MAKPYEIRLRVEEIALGSVLRKLHEMPGVVDVDLNLGEGGTGAGAKKLAEAAASLRADTNPGRIAELLLRVGPMHRHDIKQALGNIADGTLYTALGKMVKSGQLEKIRQGVYKATEGLQVLAGAPKALPAPRQSGNPTNAPAPTGTRAKRGVGIAALLQMVVGQPIARSEVTAQMKATGMTSRAVAGVIHRAEKAKLAKRDKANGTVVITERGRKHIEALSAPQPAANSMNGAVHHG